MKIILIRHGEPDYEPCNKRKFIGQGRDLAPLTERGKLQAEQVANNSILKNAELIIVSPYTRALQTAAIISRKTGIQIEVEVDLHEWIPDKTFQYQTSIESMNAYGEFLKTNGVCPLGEKRKWETIDEMEKRIYPVLNKYCAAEYHKIMVVAHGEVIRRLIDQKHIRYCMPYEIDYRIKQ